MLHQKANHSFLFASRTPPFFSSAFFLLLMSIHYAQPNGLVDFVSGRYRRQNLGWIVVDLPGETMAVVHLRAIDSGDPCRRFLNDFLRNHKKFG